MSQEFMDRGERTAVSDDPDEACSQVVRRMCGLIKDAARDPEFQGFARHAVRQFGGGPLFATTRRDPLTDAHAIAESAWLWCKTHLKFVHHSKLMQWYLGMQDGYQLLIAPTVILGALCSQDPDIRERGRRGDCAIYTMMCAAICEACGVPVEIVTLAVDPGQPGVYSHVFPRAMTDAGRLPLDASHGLYPGWQVPQKHIFRSQVWSDSGRPIADRRQRFDGLHGFERLGMGAMICDDTGACTDDGTSSSGYPVAGVDYNPALLGPQSTVPNVGSGGSFPTGNVIANLLSQWTAIGGRVIAPQTMYTVGPNGQVSYSTPGSGPLPSSLGTSLGGSSLLWLGGGALALVLLMSLGKK